MTDFLISGFNSGLPIPWLLGKSRSFGRIENYEILTNTDFNSSELITVADTDTDANFNAWELRWVMFLH